MHLISKVDHSVQIFDEEINFITERAFIQKIHINIPMKVLRFL